MLSVSGVSVAYGDFTAVDRVTFRMEAHEIVAVLGPSGSGKSSLLRAIAGLERLHTGSVALGHRDISDVPVHLRGIGLMFQDYALFPHLNVADNVGFGLATQGAPPAAATARVREVLSWVDLDGYGSRPVDSLSGGEQQRVALARALAPQPDVLLLDEPVGALDRALRARLVPELSALLRRIGMAALYVTHDQDEAFALADRVAVMRRGTVDQIGTPRNLWEEPASESIARFIGYENFADVEVHDGVAVTPWGAVPSTLSDGRHRVGVRPDLIRLDPRGDLVGTVVSSTFLTGTTRMEVECLNSTLVVSESGRGPQIGESVRIQLRDRALRVLTPPNDSSESL